MRPWSSSLKDKRGAVAAITIILMVAFFGLLALVIDLGHLLTVKNQLQNAADECALAGARAYLPYISSSTSSTIPDPALATAAATNDIKDNKSDTFTLNTASGIQTGVWVYDTNTFITPWAWPPTGLSATEFGPAIHLIVKKPVDQSINNGPVVMTLANIFGVKSVNVLSKATAALHCSGLPDNTGGCPGCQSIFPVCIDQTLVSTAGATIQFNSDNTDNGGWTNLQSPTGNTNAAQIKSIFDGTLQPGPNPVSKGTNLSLNNGVMCSATDTLIKNGTTFGLTQLVPGTKNTWQCPDPTGKTCKTFCFPVCAGSKFIQAQFVGILTATLTQASSAPDSCTVTISISGTPAVCNTTTIGDCLGTNPVLSTQPVLVQGPGLGDPNLGKIYP